VRLIEERAGVPATHFEIIAVEDTDRIGCPKMIKKMVQMAQFDIVCFLGDDTEPEPAFLREALRVMKTFDGNWGMVGLNDQYHDGNMLATHWLAHKKLLKHLDGEFFHTGYQHCFCDRELHDRACEIRRYKWAKNAKIKHNHPIIQQDQSLWDEDYKRVYSNKVQTDDKYLYQLRKQNGWKTPTETKANGKPCIGIGIPAGGEGKADFWLCLEKLRYKCAINGIDTARQRSQGAVVEHNRNKIVYHFLEKLDKNVSHILFIDDDMTFPDDLLIRLLEHDKDMVVCNAYRAKSPHFPVTSVSRKGVFFHPVHVRPDKGSLKRVDSGGTGCTLIKMDVFRKVPFPWFKSEYVPAPPHVEENNELLFYGNLFVSEDNRFFIIAQQYGFKLYCDFSIEIGHVKNKTYTWKDYEAYLNERESENDEGDGSTDLRNRDQHHN
jgi:hypothetical protein